MSIHLTLLEVDQQPWLNVVLSDVNIFLQSHADCERKASATAMTLLGKYPEKVKITRDLLTVAIDKLQRFERMFELLQQRNLQLPPDLAHDLYAKQLGWLIKNGKNERFLDKILIATFIEIREQQRLRLFAEQVQDAGLKRIYTSLLTDVNPYTDMLLKYHSRQEVEQRAAELAEDEAKIFAALDLEPCLR